MMTKVLRSRFIDEPRRIEDQFTPGRGRAVPDTAPGCDLDLSMHGPRQVVLQQAELGTPGAVVVIEEFDQEFDLLLVRRVVVQDRSVDAQMRDPMTPARVGDAIEGKSQGQGGVDVSETHQLTPRSAGCPDAGVTARISSATSSYGSTTSRKTQRPKPPWLFT